MTLPLTAGWGGARKGAGRPKVKGAGAPHVTRPVLKSRFPVHITVRVTERAKGLRKPRHFAAIKRSFEMGNNRFGFRLNHFSVQGDHMHLVVEANDKRALARGMQGLSIRIARALNRVIGSGGKVFSDRYHAHILKTPTEVRNTLVYQLKNRNKHTHTRFIPGLLDAFCSWGMAPPPTMAPRTWLLSIGWRQVRIHRRPRP